MSSLFRMLQVMNARGSLWLDPGLTQVGVRGGLAGGKLAEGYVGRMGDGNDLKIVIKVHHEDCDIPSQPTHQSIRDPGSDPVVGWGIRRPPISRWGVRGGEGGGRGPGRAAAAKLSVARLSGTWVLEGLTVAIIITCRHANCKERGRARWVHCRCWEVEV